MSVQKQLDFWGAKLEEEDVERLRSGLTRVLRLMEDGLWRSPEEIASQSGTRLDSALRYVRYLKRPEHGEFTVWKKSFGNGLFKYCLRSRNHQNAR